MDFIKENMNIVTYIAMGLGGLGGLWYVVWYFKTKGKKAGMVLLRQEVYKLMLKAEITFNENAGEEKMKWVMEQLIDQLSMRLPKCLRKFVTDLQAEEKIFDFLQECFDECMDLLDDGLNNDSYNKE